MGWLGAGHITRWRTPNYGIYVCGEDGYGMALCASYSCCKLLLCLLIWADYGSLDGALQPLLRTPQQALPCGQPGHGLGLLSGQTTGWSCHITQDHGCCNQLTIWAVFSCPLPAGQTDHGRWPLFSKALGTALGGEERYQDCGQNILNFNIALN